jgi:hypothetical protein
MRGAGSGRCCRSGAGRTSQDRAGARRTLFHTLCFESLCLQSGTVLFCRGRPAGATLGHRVLHATLPRRLRCSACSAYPAAELGEERSIDGALPGPGVLTAGVALCRWWFCPDCWQGRTGRRLGGECQGALCRSGDWCGGWVTLHGSNNVSAGHLGTHQDCIAHICVYLRRASSAARRSLCVPRRTRPCRRYSWGCGCLLLLLLKRKEGRRSVLATLCRALHAAEGLKLHRA